jgi:N-acetylneuraminic acid mutarotase
MEHWSLAVADGAARGSAWRLEAPIPIGGPHRASAVIDGRLYVFGGQTGDFVPIPGDPDCRCTGKLVTERYFPDVFVLPDPGAQWTSAAPMPLPVSHTESSVIVCGHELYFFGGQSHLERDTGMAMVPAVLRYDVRTDRWSRAGTLPYGIKLTVCGWWNGSVFVVSGQRDLGPDDPRPGRVTANVWRARLP